MDNGQNIVKKLFLLSFVLILWVTLFLWLGRTFGKIDFWGMMLIGASVITFFGMLGLPGSVDKNGSFRESRIRLAITASFIVLYLVFFGSLENIDKTYDANGDEIKTFASDLLPLLNSILMVTISFYFGSTAAIEIADSLSKKRRS